MKRAMCALLFVVAGCGTDAAAPGFGTEAPYRLASARDISGAGRITGDVEEAATGRRLAFVATPIGPGTPHGAPGAGGR